MTQHKAYQVRFQDLDIVVIDDSKTMLHLLRAMLLAMGARSVRCYDDPERGFASIRIEPPHLLILDCQMSPINGLQFLRRMRCKKEATLWDIPVLFITAHSTSQIVERAVLNGAHYVMVKPIAPKVLYRNIRFILADERPFQIDDKGAVSIVGADTNMRAQLKRKQNLFTSHAGLDAVMTVTELEARYELVFGPLDTDKMPERANDNAPRETELGDKAERAAISEGPAFGTKRP